MEKLVLCTFMSFLMTIVRLNCVFVYKALGTFLFSILIRKRTCVADSSFRLPALRRVPLLD